MSKQGKQLYNLYDIYYLIFFSTAFSVVPIFVSLAYLVDLNKLFSLTTLITLGFAVNLVVLLIYYYWLYKNKRTLQRKVKPTYNQEFFTFEMQIFLGIIGFSVIYFIANLSLIMYLFVGIVVFIFVMYLTRKIGVERFNMKF